MPLPFPVRIAAGLVVTAVEQARDLPRHVVEFPITAVSQALQATMRVQQKVTELAIKGDRALGVLRPVEERPSWATFDEDEPSGRNGTSSVTELRPPRRSAAAVEPEVVEALVREGIDESILDEVLADEPVADELDADELDSDDVVAAELDAAELDAAELDADELDAELDADELDVDEVDAEADVTATLVVDADADLTDVEAAVDAAEPLVEESTSTEIAVPEDAAAPVAASALVHTTSTQDAPAAAAADDGVPPALPDYDNMTIPQLRGRLRFLSLEDLQGLLEWETTHGERPPFLTMLSNRITTVLEG